MVLGEGIILHFKNLLDLHDFGQNEIGVRVLALWLSKFFQPASPKTIFLAPIPRRIFFKTFDKLSRFTIWTCLKWGLVYENWLQGSTFMDWLVFCNHLAQQKLLGSKALEKGKLWYLMSLLDSFYDCDCDDTLFEKIGSRVLEL